MKKRTLALLLATVMLLTIVGCGNSAAESYKTMAQGFIDDGNIESAKKTLEDGITETKSKELQAMLDGLSNADLSDYDGTWAEEDLSYENGGMIMRVSTTEGATMLSFEYAGESIGFTDGPLDHGILKNEVDGSTITIKKAMDIYENLVDMTISFSDDTVTCEITNVEDTGISPLFKKGTYTLVRNEDAYTILAETPWSDAMGVKADGFTEEPYHDTSKASGILAQLGMTEEDFRSSCQPLYHFENSRGYRITQELLDYPSQYIGQSFTIQGELAGELGVIKISSKGLSNDGYTTYTANFGNHIRIFDCRDDIYAPTISEGDCIYPYMIFHSLQTINGTDYLCFQLISADKQ